MATRHHWSRGHRSQVRACLALVAILAAGCGSGGDDEATSTPVPTSTTLAITTTSPDATLVALPDVDEDDDADGIGPPKPGEIDTSSGQPRVCLMVDLEEVASRTGTAGLTSSEGVFRDTTTCFVDDATGADVLLVAAAPADTFDEAAAAADAAPVEGLGDAAVWSEGRLHVRIGDEDLAFALGEAAQVPTADTKAVVEQLAAITVTRYLPPSSV